MSTEVYLLDSIDSGLDADDGIFAASIKLKGYLEKDIQFNDMSLAAGSIDTVINNQDQYGTHFYYEIQNDSKGKIDLDICVRFSH